MTSPLLNIRNLYCERDDRVLFEGLSFALQPGQVIQIKGRNGSGKTSLLRILTGLYQSYEGSVEYLGANISDARETYNRALLFFGHQVSVKQALTVRENLTWYAKIQPQLAASQIEQAMEQVGLSEYADVLCQNLSAGQKRRVNLARLFMHSSDNYQHSIWILDEPFTAIDVDGVANLEHYIQHYLQQGGAVILTTHQPLEINQHLIVINLDEQGT